MFSLRAAALAAILLRDAKNNKDEGLKIA